MLCSVISRSLVGRLVCVSSFLALLSACGGGLQAPLASQWLTRSQAELRALNLVAATDAANRALEAVGANRNPNAAPSPASIPVRIHAAEVALARLDWDGALTVLKGAAGAEAAGLRGRAYWYSGKLEEAAAELDLVLGDPNAKDEWARTVVKLCRSGIGRKPYSTDGALLGVEEIIRVGAAFPAIVVPVRIDGEDGLALVATAVADVVLDSKGRTEPGWIQLGFGESFEVRDVPALIEDLSGISKAVGAPIKALLGVRTLRQLNATVDFQGHQFVVRGFNPPAPSQATSLAAANLKGGGLLVPANLGAAPALAATGAASNASGAVTNVPATLAVDSTAGYPLSLDAAAWARALSLIAVDASDASAAGRPATGTSPTGRIARMQLGRVEMTEVPVSGALELSQLEGTLHVDVDGALGAGLLAQFRVTFADGGRTLWLEDDAAREAGIAALLASDAAGTE
jgi:hypothetical protein